MSVRYSSWFSVRRSPFVVLIGEGEIWGRYWGIEQAQQAVRALRQVGFAPRVESAALRNLAKRVRVIEDALL
jgi:hypothetical protein